MAVLFVHQLNTCCFLFQNEARKLNHQEVVEEDKRLKLPSNWEAKKARLEWELADNEKRKVEVFLNKKVHCPSRMQGFLFRLNLPFFQYIILQHELHICLLFVVYIYVRSWPRLRKL